MLVKEIRQTLMGKTISHFNGWNGSSDYFRIGHIVKDRTSARVFPEKGKGFGIFIPIKAIPTLTEQGEYRTKNEFEGCPFEEVWKLQTKQ